ncbi:MAG TPA: zinc ABC transporter substrate-binding protein [Pseudonocardiaceae bacterium]|jgi:zinc/manganese transport system substrate-binding protein|nr:zinc ABC transporter substrate-binding protein [Pseudonocardiaceae bacterium]
MSSILLSRARRRVPTAIAATAVLATVVSACATTAPTASTTSASGGSGKTVTVVAAENFWGSIAKQLGGSHATVTSIITNPDTDPHDYEPTTSDGRTIASAQLAIVNGIGYDPWATKLLAANATPGQTVLNVGDLVGIPINGNPHRWYSQTNVRQVVAQITADYKKADPADAAYFDQQQQTFETQTLAQYNSLISTIKAKYAGTPIGASESIVTPLAQSLGLTMLTPEGFLDAISEGTEPTAADKATIDAQIKNKQIKIYVFNSQNSTPDVQAQVAEAKAESIPVTTVTETLAPASDTFEQWQVSELQGIQAALAKATGK